MWIEKMKGPTREKKGKEISFTQTWTSSSSKRPVVSPSEEEEIVKYGNFRRSSICIFFIIIIGYDDYLRRFLGDDKKSLLFLLLLLYDLFVMRSFANVTGARFPMIRLVYSSGRIVLVVFSMRDSGLYQTAPSSFWGRERSSSINQDK